ncbi:MAG: hypothetical protein CMH78_07350 [Nitrospinae bacterium]|jgi:adenylylsulfate kinase|nr:hypothetical protein [Nitrospinota bacterium]|tara:strand:+ start:818 stop:997 length:180 start_codon:yes stop_codon:yes gene_type:complete
MIKNATIWLTGLPSSGKTTLSQRLKDNLLSNGIDNVELLDGEDFRRKLNNFNYLTYPKS